MPFGLLKELERALESRSGSHDGEVRLWQMDPGGKSFNCTHTIEESMWGAESEEALVTSRGLGLLVRSMYLEVISSFRAQNHF